jgi:hypothetical protein
LSEFARLDHQGIERGLNARPVIGVEHQPAPDLDQRAGQRLVEGALRQGHLARFAAAFLAGIVAGRQRHGDAGPGPWVLGQFQRGLDVGLAAGIARARAGAAARSAGGHRALRRHDGPEAASTEAMP